MIVLLAFGLFWTGLVGAFDFIAGKQFLQQFWSRDFPVTTGQITHSEEKTYHGSKSTTYSADIRYRYEIDGRSFENKRYRYGQGSSSSYSAAEEMVADHPLGSPVSVFYNPRDPRDSLLAPGIEGSDVMWILFLTPFNLIALAFISAGVGQLRRTIAHPVAGGVKIIKRGFCTSVRMPTISALVIGAVALGLASFIGVFVVAIVGGSHPSIALVVSVIAFAWVCGLGVYFWKWREIHSGADDLVIDESLRRLELPLTFKRKERVTIPFSDIAEVSVETRTHTSSKGATTYTYAPMIYLRNDSASQQLANWGDSQRADAFTDWLRQQVGLAPADLVTRQ